MRVSSSMIYNTGLQGLMTLQSQMFQTQNQLSTGRRMLTPADDPIGASEALEVTQSKGVNKQFLENQADAMMQIGTTEAVVAGVGERLTRIIEQAAEAKNPTLNDSQRGMIAAELKLNFNSILEFANAQDGTGLYIFAGNKSTVDGGPFAQNTLVPPPAKYDLTTTSVSYKGDAGGPAVQVSASKQMPISVNGIDVFMQVRTAQGDVIGESMFDSIQNLIALVDPSDAVPFDLAELETAQTTLESGLAHVANIRATLGARMNALDGLTKTSDDVNYLYDVRLSELQDLDYTEAISRFTRLQTQLEATQLTFKQTSQLSLFNIL